MASQIATRNIFRFAYGKRFWDQIYSIFNYRVEWMFLLFMRLMLSKLMNKYSLITAGFRWLMLTKLYLYLIVWRSLGFVKTKKPLRWRIWPHKWRLSTWLGYFKKHSFFQGQISNEGMSTLFFRQFEKQRKKLIRFKFHELPKLKKKKLNFFFLNNKTVKFILFFNKNLLISQSLNFFNNKKKLFLQKIHWIFKFFFFNFKNISLMLSLFFKKRWFLERLFTLSLTGYYKAFLSLFGLKQNFFFISCVVNNLAGLWQREAGLAARRFTSGAIKYSPHQGYFARFYKRLGLKVVKFKQLSFIWRNLLLFSYYAWLTRDWNSIIFHCKWFFQIWQRKKQGVFLFFLRRLFGRNLFLQFVPFETALSLPWIFITFSGRVHGKHKNSTVNLRPRVNYLQPFAQLNKNLLHYYTQFVTKFGVYGVHWWMLYGEFSSNVLMHQVFKKSSI